MTDITLARRDILKAGGALIVSFALPALALPRSAQATIASLPALRPLDPSRLASFLGLAADGRVTVYFGKMDPGQGIDTAVAQIVAEELDVPFEAVTVVMGDSGTSVNQGGASGSTGVRAGAQALRRAAAEARRVLVARVAERLGVPAEQLSVADGVVRAAGGQSIAYGDLVKESPLDIALKWNKEIGNGLSVEGEAKPKAPSRYRIVGKPTPRSDIPGKVFAQSPYVVDIRLPGMWHGRVIRPPVAGAVPVGVDESTIAAIPGAKVVRRESYIAVVAPEEWDAIRAAAALAVSWSPSAPPYPEMSALHDHIRRAPVHTRKVAEAEGDTDAALAGAARLVEAEYEWPFQSHASMAPGCSVADVRPDGANAWSGTQKPHFLRDGLATLLKLPPEQVRVVWVQGPGSYGRNDADDAAYDAALLSQAIGKPVRVQWSRAEGTGWDPKGPAAVLRLRAGLDKAGAVVGYDFTAKGFAGREMATNGGHPKDTLAGMLIGYQPEPTHYWGVPNEPYRFPGKRLAWETIDPLLPIASPLRTAHLRAPQAPQNNFANESFIDELAAATRSDPLAFRLRHLQEPRAIAVLKTAAEKAGWSPRGARPAPTGATLHGRGISLAFADATYVALVAEIEVERASGRIWARRITCAHDCGLVINPSSLERTIEGNIVQGLSRCLLEEVRFTRETVASVDWQTYPILSLADAPEILDIVLIDRPEVAPGGAGEPATVPVAAAIANALFDATGMRLRRVPFTAERVKAALG